MSRRYALVEINPEDCEKCQDGMLPVDSYAWSCKWKQRAARNAGCSAHIQSKEALYIRGDKCKEAEAIFRKIMDAGMLLSMYAEDRGDDRGDELDRKWREAIPSGYSST